MLQEISSESQIEESELPTPHRWFRILSRCANVETVPIKPRQFVKRQLKKLCGFESTLFWTNTCLSCALCNCLTHQHKVSCEEISFKSLQLYDNNWLYYFIFFSKISWLLLQYSVNRCHVKHDEWKVRLLLFQWNRTRINLISVQQLFVFGVFESLITSCCSIIC